MTFTMFGYLMLISIDFYDFFFSFLFGVLLLIEKIYQTLKQVFHWLSRHFKKVWPHFQNSPKFSTPGVSTLFSVFANAVTHGLSCLIYYFSFLKKRDISEVPTLIDILLNDSLSLSLSRFSHLDWHLDL